MGKGNLKYHRPNLFVFLWTFLVRFFVTFLKVYLAIHQHECITAVAERVEKDNDIVKFSEATFIKLYFTIIDHFEKEI